MRQFSPILSAVPFVCVLTSFVVILHAEEGSFAEDSRVDALGSGERVVICENCQKEVSLDSQYRERCPHCGIFWGTPLVFPNNPSTAEAVTVSVDGEELTVIENREVPPPQATASMTAQNTTRSTSNRSKQIVHVDVPPPPRMPGSGPQSVEEMNLENLPLWMKTSLFMGTISIAYYLLFYRR